MLFIKSSLSLDCKKEKKREKGVAQDGKRSLCQGSNTNESLTDTVIKTLLDSSGAVQMPPTARKYLCIHMGLIKDLAVKRH